MNDLCSDIGYLSINKHNEIICGDHVETIETKDGSMVLVLADGLGSGCQGQYPVNPYIKNHIHNDCKPYDD